MTPSEINNQKITDEIHFELKEAAHWFGSWDELRKVIDELENNEAEAAWERHMSDFDAPTLPEELEKMAKIQKTLK